MRILKGLIFTFSLAAAAMAHAHAACVSLERLDREEDTCEDNGKYVEAGLECFAGLEARIKADTAKFKINLVESGKASAKRTKQTEKFSASANDYDATIAALDALIAAAESVKKSIGGYVGDIYFPEDWDAPPEVIGPDAIAFMDSQPCYGESKTMLNELIHRVDDKIAALKNTKAVAHNLFKASSGHEAGMVASEESAVKVRARAPASQKEKVRPMDGPRSSGISGELKDQDLLDKNP